MYIAHGQGQITPRGVGVQNVDPNKTFYYFNHIL